MDLSKLGVREIASHVRTGDLDPTDVVNHHLKRIDAHNRTINALRCVDGEGALKQAELLRKEVTRGAVHGRLSGVVFSVKDSINVKGLPRSHGSLHEAIERDETNATIIERLLREGAICIGKANMAEQGRSHFTENPAFGRTINPFKPNHSPGGSGGGDSAAVSAGFASFGLGADAGGSIRVPASFCGLFGLFAGAGVVPVGGLGYFHHSITQEFCCLGPIARTLDDLRILFPILHGYDSRDPESLPRSYDQHNLSKSSGKFAWFTEIGDVGCDSEINESVKDAVTRLEAFGLKGNRVTPPAVPNTLQPFIILLAQAKLVLDDLLATQRGAPPNLAAEGKIMQRLRERLKTDLPPLTAETVLVMWQRVTALRLEIAEFFGQFDFIISPVAAIPAPLYDTTSFKVGDKMLPSEQVYHFSFYSNVLSLPSVAFPTKLNKDGLPIGAQIVGPRLSMPRLLEVLNQAGYLNHLACRLDT